MTDVISSSIAFTEKPRFTVACVAEPHGPYLSEAIPLFKTLRLLSGSLKDSDAVLYVTGEIPSATTKKFADLQVQIYVVEPFDLRCPHANKIRMIEPEYHTDYLLAVDTDIVFAGDPTSILLGSAFVAKIVDQDPLAIEHWETMFSHFNLSLPLDRYLTDFHNKEAIPYFNSGVLCVPKFLAASLKEGWATITRQLLDAYEALPTIAPHRFFTDQFALSLTIQKKELPYRAAPLSLNFPTHAKIHPKRIKYGIPPLILHHHHRCNQDGLLDYCDHMEVHPTIDKVNAILTDSSSAVEIKTMNNVSFQNKEFWNRRYADNIQLGSGIGLRGDIAKMKSKMIERFLLAIGANSVLDIGCGDMEIIKTLTLQCPYHGIDVSEVVIERNKQLYPHHKFTVGNVIDIDDIGEYESDAILCFDVLIHQHLRNNYDQLVSRLVKFAKKGGLVSGYVTYPRQAYQSEITAYHEPLTETLVRMGARKVTLVGNYRDTGVIRFEK